MSDFDSAHRSGFEAMLDSGEELQGICAASEQKGLFKGGVVAIGITDRRLIVQPLDRRGGAEGAPQSIAREQVASARAGGAGGGWYNVYAGIMDNAAVALEIRTTSGDKLKLMMMRGEGKLLGKLGGGEAQRQGLEALAGWFGAAEP